MPNILLNGIIVVLAAVTSGVLSFLGIPVAVLVLTATYLHYWHYGAETFSAQFIIIATIMTLLAVFLDNIVLFFGLKRTDATRHAYIGAVVGAFTGALSANLIGVFVFSLAGATLGEIIAGKDHNQAFRSGFNAALSLLFGSILRAVLTISLTIMVVARLLG